MPAASLSVLSVYPIFLPVLAVHVSCVYSVSFFPFHPSSRLPDFLAWCTLSSLSSHIQPRSLLASSSTLQSFPFAICVTPNSVVSPSYSPLVKPGACIPTPRIFTQVTERGRERCHNLNRAAVLAPHSLMARV
ncbi:hypothetical protein B0T09DRAFT_344833 [Sordaria sp. MPI-SDFR-AT-0083]|nr:hypothetical protein B0T09DRAFT_344833 [Sordaria sp. MPI-SDFR-AT-0083]